MFDGLTATALSCWEREIVRRVLASGMPFPGGVFEDEPERRMRDVLQILETLPMQWLCEELEKRD